MKFIQSIQELKKTRKKKKTKIVLCRVLIYYITIINHFESKKHGDIVLHP